MNQHASSFSPSQIVLHVHGIVGFFLVYGMLVYYYCFGLVIGAGRLFGAFKGKGASQINGVDTEDERDGEEGKVLG